MLVFRALLWPRLATALGDSLAGYVLLAFITGQRGRVTLLPFLLLAAVLLNFAGPAWRDLFAARDRLSSDPAVPPPADMPSLTALFALAAVLTAAGWLSAMVGGHTTFLTAGTLATVALAGGAGLARLDGVGAGLGGLERGLTVLIGMGAHGAVDRLDAGVMLMPALVAIYTALTILVAQQEKLPTLDTERKLHALVPAPVVDDEPEEAEGGNERDTGTPAIESDVDAASGEPDAPEPDAEAESAARVAARDRERRAVARVMALNAMSGEAPVHKGLLALSGLALASMPPVAAWLSAPEVDTAWWARGWIATAAFAALTLALLAQGIAGWIRPTVARRRKLVRTALGGWGLFNVGLVAGSAHYAMREWYPGFRWPLPEPAEMAGLGMLLALAFIHWAMGRRADASALG